MQSLAHDHPAVMPVVALFVHLALVSPATVVALQPYLETLLDTA
jgi:hypothetical protein